MKVIDLLNKIANGEKLPNKIKYGKLILEKIERSYGEIDYVNNEGYNLGGFLWLHNLNDEIEIIEEDKPIEKLEKIPTSAYHFGKGITYCNFTNEQNINVLYLKNKINEIIDVVNELKERE